MTQAMTMSIWGFKEYEAMRFKIVKRAFRTPKHFSKAFHNEEFEWLKISLALLGLLLL